MHLIQSLKNEFSFDLPKFSKYPATSINSYYYKMTLVIMKVWKAQSTHNQLKQYSGCLNIRYCTYKWKLLSTNSFSFPLTVPNNNKQPYYTYLHNSWLANNTTVVQFPIQESDGILRMVSPIYEKLMSLLLWKTICISCRSKWSTLLWSWWSIFPFRKIPKTLSSNNNTV